MRLNGRWEICDYLHRARTKEWWWRLRKRYGMVIYRIKDNGHVWALTDDLDALDADRSEIVGDGIRISRTEWLRERRETKGAGRKAAFRALALPQTPRSLLPASGPADGGQSDGRLRLSDNHGTLCVICTRPADEPPERAGWQYEYPDGVGC